MTGDLLRQLSPARRGLAATALLLVEGLIIAVRFDSGPLAAFTREGWARPLGHVSEVPRVAIACGTVLVLLGRDLPARLTALAPRSAAGRLALAVHALAVVAFVALSTRVLDAPTALAWTIPWLAAGSVAVGALGVFVLPGDAWLRAVRASWPLLTGALLTGIAAWTSGVLTRELAPKLQGITSRAVFRFVAIFRDDATLAPETFVVGTPRFHVEVAPACSGYEGMGLVAVFLGCFLWTHRRELRFPAALSLVPIALVATALANVARIGSLVLLGEVSPEIARGGFHSYAGAVLFSAIALATAHAALRLPAFALSAPPARIAWEPTAADAFLGPLVVTLAIQLLTGLAAHDAIDRLHPVRIFGAAVALACVRSRLPLRRSIDVAAPVLGCAVAIAWVLLAPREASRDADLARAATATPPVALAAWLISRALGSVVVAPIVEELAFRGYLARRLTSPDFESVDPRQVAPLGVAVSSVVFGLFHPQLLAGTVAGFVYAFAARRRGRLEDAIVAHASTNASLVLYAATTGRWSTWL